jgi:hypothetical protein
MRVAVFTDNDFDKVNGVTTTLTALVGHAPADISVRIYTAAALATDDPHYLALRSCHSQFPSIAACICTCRLVANICDAWWATMCMSCT